MMTKHLKRITRKTNTYKNNKRTTGRAKNTKETPEVVSNPLGNFANASHSNTNLNTLTQAIINGFKKQHGDLYLLYMITSKTENHRELACKLIQIDAIFEDSDYDKLDKAILKLPTKCVKTLSWYAIELKNLCQLISHLEGEYPILSKHQEAEINTN